MAFLFWQSIKLSEAVKGEAIFDNEFFSNERMQKVLDLPIFKSNNVEIQRMAEQLLGVSKTGENFEVILS